MKSLEVTDEQFEYIQQLREEISEDVVGKYGFVRERDAVQFLIDNLGGDLEVDGEFDFDMDAASGRLEGGVKTNAITYDEDTKALEDEGGDSDVDSDDSATDDERADETAGESEDGDESDASDADGEDDEGENEDEGDDLETADGAADSATDSAAEDEDDEDDTNETDGDGAASDDDMLDRMMNLLDTHDDKWEESPSADYRYRVELPDGATEDVQTKDDVRAILFKNYR